MGKPRLVAETGAGQHGVATATAAALFGMECTVYMGDVDMARQELNVFRMRLLGAEVRPGQLGQPDAEGRRQRGAARLGGHRRDDPLLPRVGDGPASVSVDGARVAAGRRRRGPRPRRVRCSTATCPTSWSRAWAGGRTRPGSSPASPTPTAELVGVEPAGGAAIGHGVPGIVHGMRSYLVQDEFGQVLEAESISAGLDYPGVGPEHSHLAADRTGPLRGGHRRRGDRRVPPAVADRGDHPGARVRAHALAWVSRRAGVLAGKVVLVNLSGRGDKDVAQMMDSLG